MEKNKLSKTERRKMFFMFFSSVFIVVLASALTNSFDQPDFTEYTGLASTDSLKQGAVVYYPFNSQPVVETTFNAQIAPSPVANYGADFSISRISSALTFKEADDRLQLTNPFLNDQSFSKAISISAWVRQNPIVCKTSVSSCGGMIVSKDATNARGYTLYTGYWAGAEGIPYFVVFQGTTQFSVSSPKKINDGLMHHIAAVYDSASMTLSMYVDGELSAVRPAPSSINLPVLNNVPVTTFIGNRYINGGWGKVLPGTIDEVAIFNRPLTENEVKHMFYQGEYYAKNYFEPFTGGCPYWTQTVPEGCLLNTEYTTSGITENIKVNNDLIIGPTGKFIFLKDKPGNLNVAGNLLKIQSGGSIVCERKSIYEGTSNTNSDTGFEGLGRTINVQGDLIVESGGSITAVGKGFDFNKGPGKAISNNYGASHGGAGGNGGSNPTVSPTYGSALSPLSLGSGGQTASGGGAIRITANSIAVEGSIIADGAAGTFAGSSGGSIYLQTNELKGNGIISASGGDLTSYDYNGGGGGRISLEAENYLFTGTVDVSGGFSTKTLGRTGTVKFPESSLKDFTVNNNLYLGGDMEYTFGKLTIPSGAILYLDGNTAAGYNSATGKYEGTGVSITADIIDVKGEINANNRGFEYLKGPGAGSDSMGGTHGGKGSSNPASVYGSAENPISLGSGGGPNGHTYGGGAVKLTANKVIIDGLISANGKGVEGTGLASGGAGGSVWITTDALEGTCRVSAKGGAAPLGYGGGGGRIAIYYRTTTCAKDSMSVEKGSGNGAYPLAEDGTLIFASLSSVCGNNYIEKGEACDDGNANNCDGCSSDCTRVDNFCGDGITECNEPCDDGNPDNEDFCKSDCTLNVCGDTFKFLNTEECEDGNTESCDSCSSDCKRKDNVCGDGIVECGETCDDNNNDNCDGCFSDCQRKDNVCGDGVLECGEECDDGNQIDGDGCNTFTANCRHVCGDSKCDSDETCISCPNDCGRCPPACGDNTIDQGEVCDDGNKDNCDGCISDCSRIDNVKGDGILECNEFCDDGNTKNCDGCSADGSRADNICGDKLLECDEECDDGNPFDDDACKSDCTLNVCGDNVLKTGVEVCDDGNEDDKDSCKNDCTPNICGDGVILTGFEDCDDENNENGDLCPADCRYRCGDAICNNGEDKLSCNADCGDKCDSLTEESRLCGNEVGICQGIQYCVAALGVWDLNCIYKEPVEEICNDNLDNDCDSEVDEGCQPPAAQLSCKDSDGADKYILGYLNLINARGQELTIPDKCADDTTLQEKLCTETGSPYSENFVCPNGCSEGACICTADEECSAGYVCIDGKCILPPAVVCTDTDINSQYPDGINYELKGTVKTNDQQATDFCFDYENFKECQGSSPCVLVEHSCTAEKTILKEKYTECPICIDGACQPKTCGDAICDPSENCNTCPDDCIVNGECIAISSGSSGGGGGGGSLQPQPASAPREDETGTGGATEDIYPPCPIATTLCSDGLCRADCEANIPACNEDLICDEGEGCTCADCAAQQDDCESNLICNADTKLCDNPLLQSAQLTSACGNAVCDEGEDPASCPSDCPIQEAAPQEAAPSGGSPGGGGGGGGGSKSKTPAQPEPLGACTESWVCDKWTPDPCTQGQTQTRNCADWNKCTTETLKPATTRACQQQVQSPQQQQPDTSSGFIDTSSGNLGPKTGKAFETLTLTSIFPWLWWLLLLIAVIILIVYYERRKAKKQLEKEKSKMTAESLSSLDEYVQKALQQGHSPDAIKQKLLQAGWSKNIIDNALRGKA